jgi:pilus assembly protein Flp/PilA
MLKSFKSFVQDQSGATAIEYGLIAAGIALTIIPVMGDVNSGVLQIFGVVGGLFDQVM